MKISQVTGPLNSMALNNNTKSDLKDSSFENMLGNAIKDINKEQVQGYKAMENIATGRVENLQKAVQQIEEAELSLKLALEVKNKMVSGTKQILQMQI